MGRDSLGESPYSARAGKVRADANVPLASGGPAAPLVLPPGALGGAVAAGRARHALGARPAATERVHRTPLACAVWK